jgi:hypothetical protein
MRQSQWRVCTHTTANASVEWQCRRGLAAPGLEAAAAELGDEEDLLVRDDDLGFGRTAASDTGVPSMLDDLV